jgi:hypothetical protein
MPEPKDDPAIIADLYEKIRLLELNRPGPSAPVKLEMNEGWESHVFYSVFGRWVFFSGWAGWYFPSGYSPVGGDDLHPDNDAINICHPSRDALNGTTYGHVNLPREIWPIVDTGGGYYEVQIPIMSSWVFGQWGLGGGVVYKTVANSGGWVIESANVGSGNPTDEEGRTHAAGMPANLTYSFDEVKWITQEDDGSP